MLDESAARAVASLDLRGSQSLGAARELNKGWFFPIYEVVGMVGGHQGVIVNKQSGTLFHLGSAYPVQRDLTFYERGYQFDRYDLEVLTVASREPTLRLLSRVAMVAEPQEPHGMRSMNRRELEQLLDRGRFLLVDVSLYFVVEDLERARDERWFTFEVREHA